MYLYEYRQQDRRTTAKMSAPQLFLMKKKSGRKVSGRLVSGHTPRAQPGAFAGAFGFRHSLTAYCCCCCCGKEREEVEVCSRDETFIVSVPPVEKHNRWDNVMYVRTHTQSKVSLAREFAFFSEDRN